MNHSQNYTPPTSIIKYISTFFQALIKSKAGKELTESHEREAVKRRDAMPSHHHYMVQPTIKRADYFRKQYTIQKERLEEIMQQEGFRFKKDYNYEEAEVLDFARLESLIEPI